MIDDGGYAYPQETGYTHSEGSWIVKGGKTLLDDFAGQAMLYYNSRRKSMHEDESNLSPEEIDALIAKASYLMAEAMVAEKRKRKK